LRIGVDSGGDPGPGGLRERVELQEVPGDGEPENAADDERGPQVGVLAAHGAAQVGDPLVQERAHRLGRLRGGEHGPDEGPGLRGQRPEPNVEHVVQMRLYLARTRVIELDGDREEGGLRSVVLHDQGRVDVRALGDAADGGGLKAAFPELRAGRGENALRGRRPLGGPAFRSALRFVHGPTLPLLSESCTVGSTDDE
jgi:hypothetical protein